VELVVLVVEVLVEIVEVLVEQVLQEQQILEVEAEVEEQVLLLVQDHLAVKESLSYDTNSNKGNVINIERD